jgi:hypothetical protein
VFLKGRLTDQEVRTLRGVIAALERRPTRRDRAETLLTDEQAAAVDPEPNAGKD